MKSDIVERLDNIDVRAPRPKREITNVERENGRIDWRVRCTENMEKMKTHTINDIYQS